MVIRSWTESHSYLCSGYSRDPVMAIHTWQALRTHKEAHSSPFRYFFKVLFWVNNCLEKCARWLLLKTYRVSFGPREARNSSRTWSPLQGKREKIDKSCSIITTLRTWQRGEHSQRRTLEIMLFAVTNTLLNSLCLPWDLLLLEVLAVLDHPVWKQNVVTKSESYLSIDFWNYRIPSTLPLPSQ